MSAAANVLRTEVITGLVRKFMPTANEFVGMALAPRKGSSKFPGQTATWDVFQRGRHAAEYNSPGSPAKRQRNMVKQSISTTCAYIREAKALSAKTLYWLRQPGGQFNSQYAEQGVRDELEDLNGIVDRRVEQSIWEMFSGTLTVNQADVKFTVDYGMDGSHKPTVATSWADLANADPLADLRAWKKLIQRDGNGLATDVYMNETVMGYLVDNAAVRSLIEKTPSLQRQIAETGWITRWMGLNFHVNDRGITPLGGAFTPYIGEDKVIMIDKGNSDPGGKVTNDLFDILEGSSLDIQAQGNPGKFSKSWEDHDPSARQILVEWYEIPALQQPELVVYADVVP